MQIAEKVAPSYFAQAVASLKDWLAHRKVLRVTRLGAEYKRGQQWCIQKIGDGTETAFGLVDRHVNAETAFDLGIYETALDMYTEDEKRNW